MACCTDCVMQMLVEPFVVQGRIGFQQMSIEINGQHLSTALLPEHAALEIKVPAELIVAGSPIEVAFTIPTATRPIDITGINDDRELGVRFTQLILFTRLLS
jgi:hypothetical protein